MGPIGMLLAGVLSYELVLQSVELQERWDWYRWSRYYCNLVKKPLLRIGVRRSRLEPPNGDVTLDIDPEVLSIPGGVHGDERGMPFSNKQFGVCFNEHTLEHLHTVDDVRRAIHECVRVAEVAVLLCPSPYSIWGTFLCNTHYLRLWFDGNQIVVSDNQYRTGLGVSPGAVRGDKVGQVLVLRREMPVVAT